MLTKKERINKLAKKIRHAISPYSGEQIPVFICGEQRSGTNFLMDVLNRRKDTLCYQENDDEAFDDYVLRHESVIKALIGKSKAKAVVFKPICDSQNVAQLFGAFSGAKCIWTFRRFEDVVNSSLRRFTEHREYLRLMIDEPERARWRVQNVTEEHMDLVRHYYNAGVSDSSARALIWYLRNSLFFQQGLDKDARVIVTRYEDLVSQPEESFKKVFTFLGMEQNEEAAQIAFTSSMGKNIAPEVDPEIASLCASLYRRLEEFYISQS